MKKIVKSIARKLGYQISQIPPPAGHVVFHEAMDRQHDLLVLKAFATRAAEFSTSPQETQVICNLHLTGILKEQPYVGISRVEVGNENTLQVGIWKKKSGTKDAPFVRRTDCDWFDWANKETIEPKRAKRRVVLVGESVARGYLYDPEFTPASALEGMLRSHLGTAEIDVVDLARSSLTMQPLKTLIGQSLALLPDVIVIFAGNNWHFHLNDSHIPYVDSLLRKDGVPGMKSFIDGCAERAVTQLITETNTLLQGPKITVIWVVPEFNLDDWKDPVSNAPLLSGQYNKQWRDLDGRASRAFGESDFILAEKFAREMVELDGGTNAVPLRVLAECCRLNADLQGTRRYLEMCRDAEGWDPSFMYSPRTSSSIQKALRGAASVAKNVVVDLPDLFDRFLNGGLPNRRLFLDYCHLTAEGINVAMAAVASKVLMALAGRAVPIEDLQSKSFSPSREVEGKASFLAAVHNAHYYQSYDLAHYWCARALEFWPESAEVMARFVDFQTRGVFTLACKSAIELSGARELDTLRYLMRGGRKRVDIVLSDAIIKCLSTIGTDIRNDVSMLRSKEHSIKSGPKELTDFYYSSAMLGPLERIWTSKSFSTNRGSHCIYASAFWETSKFIFFSEKEQPVGLRLTFRVPDLSGSGEMLAIKVNGHLVAQAPAGESWQTLEMFVLGDNVVDGKNEIVITWPNQDERSQVTLDRAADALLARRLPRFYRVFGEIHSLLAFDPFGRAAELNDDCSSVAETEVNGERRDGEPTSASSRVI
jgi:hypothetical protein